jgi:hypothetical protein
MNDQHRSPSYDQIDGCGWAGRTSEFVATISKIQNQNLPNNFQFAQTNSDSLLPINVTVRDDLDGDSQRSVVTKIRRCGFRGWMDVPPVTTSTSSDRTTSTTSDHYPEASGGFRN